MSMLMVALNSFRGYGAFVAPKYNSYGTVSSVKKMNDWENKQSAYGGAGGMSGWNTSPSARVNLFGAAREAQRKGYQGSALFLGAAYASMGASSMQHASHGGKNVWDGIRLGLHSQEYREKWGGVHQSQSTGWIHTLTQAPDSKSTHSPTQKFDAEVFQTLETRKRMLGGSSFQRLMEHARNPNLSPSLANMYKEATNLAGVVRKSTRRII